MKVICLYLGDIFGEFIRGIFGEFIGEFIGGIIFGEFIGEYLVYKRYTDKFDDGNI